MFKIEKPGFYPDISAADYFADPAPAPSLTQSVAKILLDQSPLHAWHAHPKLNPDYRHDDSTKFDVGNIAHAMLLNRGKEIEVIQGFDDWRKKEAKELREEAHSKGRLAVLGKHYHRADKMVKAAREQLEQRGLGNLFTEGQGEVVMAWQEHGTWMRQMVDWLTPGRLIFADYKTTDMSVAPQNLGRMMVNAGWQIQAAMGERGLDKLDPANAGRRRYLFVVQEAELPYCLNVVEIGEAALTIGRKLLDIAQAQWQACVKSDRWPGYSIEIVRPEIPGWFESGVLAREIEHHDNILMAG